MMKALIVVDVQNDFLPAGALPVPEGDRVVPVANRLMERFDLVVAAQDWHPADHGSFAAIHPDRKPGEVVELEGLEQILWPIHCVQGTAGAELHPDLNRAGITRVFRKGTDRNVDSYSGFFDNGHRKATGLGDYLHEQGVTGVYVCGLATDYCVKATALDALELRFATCLVEDACRGVDLSPGDVERAIVQVTEAGVRVVRSTQIEGESE